MEGFCQERLKHPMLNLEIKKILILIILQAFEQEWILKKEDIIYIMVIKI
jgi:hypothetical protein